MTPNYELIGKLMLASKLELEIALANTDNPKFKKIIEATIALRFPNTEK